MPITTQKPYISHLLSIDSLSIETIEYILKQADYYLNQIIQNNRICNVLEGKVVLNLFFEPSTRTRHSFEIAAKKLNAIVLNPSLDSLSTLKGESLLDTIKTFEAMGTNLFVIRHKDNNTPEFLASELHASTSVINAGDGCHQHPTQCLTDLLTIKKCKPNLPDIKITLIGDIAHSRVARSLLQGLKIMGATNIHLVGPHELIPEELTHSGYTITDSLKEGLMNADIVMPLRIQRERIEETDYPDPEKYHAKFGITEKKLYDAKPDVAVMHPGPINRGIEIASSIADGQNSVILQQVQNGVAIRMAIMDMLLNRT